MPCTTMVMNTERRPQPDSYHGGTVLFKMDAGEDDALMYVCTIERASFRSVLYFVLR